MNREEAQEKIMEVLREWNFDAEYEEPSPGWSDEHMENFAGAILNAIDEFING